MSTTLEPISLDTLVKNSKLIVVGKRASNAFIISETLWNQEKKDLNGKTITVQGANDELYKQIEEARAKGQPYPFPIVQAYKSTLSDTDFKADGPFILFLRPSQNDYAFATENAYENLKKKKEILQLILKVKK